MMLIRFWSYTVIYVVWVRERTSERERVSEKVDEQLSRELNQNLHICSIYILYMTQIIGEIMGRKRDKRINYFNEKNEKIELIKSYN